MATRTWTGTTSGDWGVSTNWQEGAVPVAGDNVFFYNNSVSVTAGLDQHLVVLASLIVESTYTGTFGTASTFLQVGATVCTIGGPGANGAYGIGSGRLNINLGAGGSTVTVLFTPGAGTDSGEPPLRLLGTVTSNILGGFIGYCTEDSDTGTATAINVGTGNASGSAPTIYVGPGATVTTWDIASGTITDDSNNATTTININGGQYTREGSGAVTTLTVNSGQCYFNSTGTLTTANVRGTLDFSRDTRSKTVTNCTAYAGATINANNGVPNSITFTNGVVYSGCLLAEVSFDVGYGRTVKIS